jgi:hypothetical protein
VDFLDVVIGLPRPLREQVCGGDKTNHRLSLRRLEVPLHAINANRDAVNEREQP